MKYFLMYEIGECNDSLRDRMFFHVKADNEIGAHAAIFTHYQQPITYTRNGVTKTWPAEPWTMEQVIDMYGPFVASESPITIPDPCEFDDRKIIDLTLGA